MTLKHQLIIFYGSSPGAGKSTLSSFLYDQLRLHDMPMRWVYENDLLYLDAFQQFVQEVQSGNRQQIDTLLAASHQFVSEFIGNDTSRDTVLLMDSIFPCFNWLVATGYYSHERIQAFGLTLEQILTPLNPLTIYLDVDQHTALTRAVAQRGQQWLDDTIRDMSGYGLHQDKPPQTFDDVVAYFKMAGDLSLAWLQGWQSDVLVLDATHNDIEHLKALLLAEIGLDEWQADVTVDVASLQALTGVYVGDDVHAHLQKQLAVTLVDDTLWVDAYWPTGSVLVPEGEHRFRLQNTSHRIEFGQFQDGQPNRLTYDNQGGLSYYHRVQLTEANYEA
ncbi:MAG: hypothetical protein AAF639_20045 [Chloroflexota bacterium]